MKVESDLKVPELPSTVDDNKKTRKEKGKPKRHLIEAEETVNKHDSTVSSRSSFIVSYMSMTVTCKSAWYHKSVFNWLQFLFKWKCSLLVYYDKT